MKNLYVTGLLAACILLTHPSTAQEPFPVKQHLPRKPLMFSGFPEKSACSLAALQKIFSSRIAEHVTIQLQNQLFAGEVIEKVQRSPVLLSINIRSTNFPGALFNISMVTLPGKRTTITGRIINPQSGDVLLLSEENNQYYLLKQPQQFFMTE